MTDTIHLQGIGQFPAKPASDFQIGDFAVWNQGYTSQVINVEPKGKKFLTWRIRTKDGKMWDRIVKADRLVAFSSRELR
jgi:hypothetical protein